MPGVPGHAGQGFAQAAEDAHALAASVRDGGVVADTLRAFEDARWQRAARIGDTEAVRPRRMSAAVASDTCAHAQQYERHVHIIT